MFYKGLIQLISKTILFIIVICAEQLHYPWQSTEALSIGESQQAKFTDLWLRPLSWIITNGIMKLVSLHSILHVVFHLSKWSFHNALQHCSFFFSIQLLITQSYTLGSLNKCLKEIWWTFWNWMPLKLSWYLFVQLLQIKRPIILITSQLQNIAVIFCLQLTFDARIK